MLNKIPNSLTNLLYNILNEDVIDLIDCFYQRRSMQLLVSTVLRFENREEGCPFEVACEFESILFNILLPNKTNKENINKANK